MATPPSDDDNDGEAFCHIREFLMTRAIRARIHAALIGRTDKKKSGPTFPVSLRVIALYRPQFLNRRSPMKGKGVVSPRLSSDRVRRMAEAVARIIHAAARSKSTSGVPNVASFARGPTVVFYERGGERVPFLRWDPEQIERPHREGFHCRRTHHFLS
jgi:hypothetical protein